MPPVFGESKSFTEYCIDLTLQLFILAVDVGNNKVRVLYKVLVVFCGVRFDTNGHWCFLWHCQLII